MSLKFKSLFSVAVLAASSLFAGESMAADVCYYNANTSSGGSAVYLYGSSYTWTLNNQKISGSSASQISYGGNTYYRGAKRTTFSLGRAGELKSFEICMLDPNVAPSVTNYSMTINEDTTGTKAVSVTDPDAGDTHTLAVVSKSGYGTSSFSGSTFTFKPDLNWNGSTTVTFRATDSKGAVSNIGTMSITVNPVNDKPVGIQYETK
ncbi:Ig-like domain-containing protein [Pseudomonas sp. GOM6]|uniref:Ig-like domain-containing protein n=1 Tax=Pseudomonas sp. GOM6 TaxID=3036944 RepID=UPI002409E63E|nr:Ig-like domain-containing protein [Pseudomonas sp. GOM6]MDG1581049.1 Ig-like domain-containing protein [Pseudomonas sp. GOM6]